MHNTRISYLTEQNDIKTVFLFNCINAVNDDFRKSLNSCMYLFINIPKYITYEMVKCIRIIYKRYCK